MLIHRAQFDMQITISQKDRTAQILTRDVHSLRVGPRCPDAMTLYCLMLRKSMLGKLTLFARTGSRYTFE